jgi:hypothetical protein
MPDGGTRIDYCTPSKGLEQAAPWPMSGRCVERRGWSNHVSATRAVERWSVEVDAASDYSPQVDSAGNIYISTEDYFQGVTSLRPNGDLRWKSKSGNGAGVALGNGTTLYVAAGSGELGLTALLKGDGTRAWNYPTSAENDCSPLIDDDSIVYTGAYDGVIFAAQPDGGRAWDHTLDGGVNHTALAPDGTLYVSTIDGLIYALAREGELKWTTNVQGAAYLMVGLDGTLYAASQDSRLYALQPDGGTAWTYATGGKDLCRPALDPSGAILVGSSDEKLHGIELDGGVRWTYAARGTVGAPAIAADGVAYFGTTTGEIHAVAVDGGMLWTASSPGDATAQPAIGADGTLYFVSRVDGGAVVKAFAP